MVSTCTCGTCVLPCRSICVMEAIYIAEYRFYGNPREYRSTPTDLRICPQEWALSAYHHSQDVANAEFIRTFRSVTFPGAQLVARLEEELKKTAKTSVRKVLIPPRSTLEKEKELFLRHFPDLYGFRGGLPDNEAVYYLNPWEFAALWEVRRLPEPTPDGTIPSLTKWKDPQEAKGGSTVRPYVLNPAAVEYHRGSHEVLFYPSTPGGTDLRNTWYMLRQLRPMVPAPSNTPMPDKYSDVEKKACSTSGHG